MSSIDVAGGGTGAAEQRARATDTRPGSLSRTVSVVGGLAIVLYVVAFALTPAHAPDSGTPGPRIAHYATVHRGRLLVSDLLLAAATAVLVVFAAALYRLIRRAEPPDGWLAIGGLASVLAGAGLFGAGTALMMTATYRPEADPGVLRALWDAAWIAYNSSGFAFGAWIGIVAVSTLRTHVLPAWTAWVGIPIALINLIGPVALKAGTGAFSPQGSLALVVGVTFPLWVLAICIGAWRSGAARAMPAP